MPGSKNSININLIGKKGKTLDRTTSEQALDFDITTSLSAPVNAHTQDPLNAHGAEAISLKDISDYYPTNNVESATSHIGATLSEDTQGVVNNCTFTSVGLVLTLAAGSTVKIRGQEINVGEQSITLTSSTPQWIYIDHTTRALTKSTSLPTLIDGHVLLWGLLTDGVSVTFSRDYRYFVVNSNRKDSITVRYASTSTGSFDEKAEGNFLSIEAALNYLSTRASEEAKREIILRGSHTISSTLTVPLDNITFVGDGKVTLSTGSNGLVMFELNSCNNISFKNLNFQCEHTACTAIKNNASSGSDDLLIENCSFISGANPWASNIGLFNTSSASLRPKILNSYFVGISGVTISKPSKVLIQGCNFEGAASAITGISIGVSGTPMTTDEAVSIVSDCTIQGFDIGIYVKGDGCKISNTLCVGTGASGTGFGVYIADGDRNVLTSVTVKDVFTGIYSDTSANETQIIGCTSYGFGTGGLSGGIRTLSPKTIISSCTVDSGPTGGLAVRLEANYCVLTGSLLTNTTTSWTGQVPGGVLIYGTGVKVSGCTIQNFHNTVSSIGYGIYLDNSANEVDITDCVVTGCYVGITCNSTLTYTGIGIKGCSFKSNITYGIDMYYASFLTICDSRFHNTANTNAINVNYGTDININNNHIYGNGSTQIGIKVSGSDTNTQRVYRAVIANNCVYSCTVQSIYAGTFVRGLTVSGNIVDGYLGATSNSTAQGIYLNRIQDAQISSNVIWRCINGIIVYGVSSVSQAENINIVGNTIHHCAWSTTPSEVFDTEGSKGIGLNWALNVSVRDNEIYSIGSLITDAKIVYQPSGSNVYSYGIYFVNSEFCSVSNNRIHTLTAKGSGTSRGIAFDHWNAAITFDNNKITGNSIDSADVGIRYNVTVGTVSAGTSIVTGTDISSNTISNTIYGIDVYVDSTSAYASTFANANVSHNKIESSAGHAILCQAANYGSLYNITLNSNNINLAADVDGIHINSLAPTTITYGNFYIQNNTFRNTVSVSGNAIKIDSTSDTWEVANISGNNIYDFKNGIYVGTTTSGNVNSIQITNNNIYESDGLGILLEAATSYNYLTISGNTITGKSTNQSNHIKILALTGVGNQTNITNNTLNFCATAAISIDVGYLLSALISGNNIKSDGSNINEVGIQLATSNVSTNIINTRIDNNIIRGMGSYGISIEVTNAGELTDLAIENNQLFEVGTGSNSWSSIYIHSGATQTRDLVVRNNTIKNSNTTGCSTGAIYIECDGTETDLPRMRIQNNHIRNCYGNGIYITSGDLKYFDHGQITGNLIDTVTEHGIYVQLSDSASIAARDGRITQHLCSGNQISAATKDGIFYDVNELDDLTSVSFMGNQCTENSENGIHISTPLGNGVVYKYARDLLISNNMCKTNGGHGIFIDADEITRRSNIIQLTISNNMTNDNSGSGIFVHHSPDAGFLNNLLITGNTCSSNGSATLDCGIYVISRGSTSKNHIISNNILSSNYDVGFRIYTGVADQVDGGAAEVGANAGSITSVMWIGNMSRNNATSSGIEDVSSGGTNWPPTYGNNIGNIDSGTTSGQWGDHDGASWTITANTSI